MGSVVGMIRAVENLAPPTRDAVLDRLGFSGTPTVDRPGLDAVYLAWCRTVPFDNVIKRIDIVGGTAPFRNDLPEDFFALFLAHGTGGTCWPSTRALAALLRSIGFDVRLGSASMADDVAGRVHTHGTILATLDDELLWVDTSMLTDVPVPLVRGAATALAHPFRPVRVEPVDDLWRVHWMQSARPASMGCLLLDDDVDGDHYSARYEWSRGWSPFNTSLSRPRTATTTSSRWRVPTASSATPMASATRACSTVTPVGRPWSRSSAIRRRSPISCRRTSHPHADPGATAKGGPGLVEGP
jgi:N-hydroxyarylamine O-acetyltransferase